MSWGDESVPAGDFKRPPHSSPPSRILFQKMHEPAGGFYRRRGGANLFVRRSCGRKRLVNPGGTSSVTARINGVDYLLISPEGLQWEYGGNWSRVGVHDGVSPALVNGIVWWPDWPDPMTSSVLATRDFTQWCAAEERLGIRVGLQDTGVVNPGSLRNSKSGYGFKMWDLSRVISMWRSGFTSLGDAARVIRGSETRLCWHK